MIAKHNFKKVLEFLGFSEAKKIICYTKEQKERTTDILKNYTQAIFTFGEFKQSFSGSNP